VPAWSGRAAERAARGARLHSYVDFVVCLGGDGTILHASSLFQRAIPPVISFSLGSLGFLTNHTLASAEADLRGVIYGCEDLDQCALDEEARPGVFFLFRCPHGPVAAPRPRRAARGALPRAGAGIVGDVRIGVVLCVRCPVRQAVPGTYQASLLAVMHAGGRRNC
jgi:hypothetical protein